MITRGRVQNGVVVLNDGVRIPEGQEVTILAPDKTPNGPLGEGSQRHSILDIPAISLGPVLRPLAGDDDLLGEMLEERP
jgi:hypothetical protein